MAFFVYLLRSLKRGRCYIGQTHEITKRLQVHNQGRVISTKAYRPYELIHVEEFNTRTEARKRELYLKSPEGWLELQAIKKRGRGFPEGTPSGPFRR